MNNLLKALSLNNHTLTSWNPILSKHSSIRPREKKLSVSIWAHIRLHSQAYNRLCLTAQKAEIENSGSVQGSK